MTTSLAAAKVALLVFFTALLQVTTLNSLEIVGGTPDVLLVVLVVVALSRGAVAGACAGFFGGLIADTATLGTLGFTSLLLTVVGYWAGRVGEPSGRGGARGRVLAIAGATIGYALGALGLHAVLGEEVSVRAVLLDSLPPTIALNVLVALAVRGLIGRLVDDAAPRLPEVRLVA